MIILFTYSYVLMFHIPRIFLCYLCFIYPEEWGMLYHIFRTYEDDFYANIKINDAPAFTVRILSFNYHAWLCRRTYLCYQLFIKIFVPWNSNGLPWAEAFCMCSLLQDRKMCPVRLCRIIIWKPVPDPCRFHPRHTFFILILLCIFWCNKF